MKTLTVAAVSTVHSLCFPGVTQAADPPIRLRTAWRYRVRPGVPVSGGMPFSGNLGKSRLQVIEAREQLSARAVGAAGPHVRSTADGGRPLMATAAQPPDHSVGSACALVWTSPAVLRGMPLQSNFRIDGGQIVDAGNNQVARTYRAPCAFGGAAPVFRLPLMAARTPPPNLLAAPIRQFPEPKFTVLCGVCHWSASGCVDVRPSSAAPAAGPAMPIMVEHNGIHRPGIGEEHRHRP